MVKKLFKHEFSAWCRILPIVYFIFIVASIMGRILQMFESDAVAYDILFASTMVIYVIGLIVCIGFPTVFGIYRFYKNLFSNEGYLSFTLPVKASSHILVKLLTAITFDIISFVIVIASALIMLSGEAMTEVINAINYLYAQIPEAVINHIPIFIIEFIIIVIASELSRYLLYYTCICVGQLFNKNRVLASVGAYFVYYLISQLIGTFISIIYAISSTSSDNMLYVINTVDDLIAYVHVIMWIGIILSAVIAEIMFLLSHHIMKKRLNLE